MILNPTTEKILSALRQRPDDVSGEVLCRTLSISRAAVWKHIKMLRGLGYRIESATHRGYRLVGVPDIPYPWEIRPHLQTSILGREFLFRQSLDSTNSLAGEAAKNHVAEGFSVIADHQEQGRGRLRRPWISPPGKNLYISMVLRPSIMPMAVSQLSLMAALALRRVVREMVDASLHVQVKWPNDVMVGGRKVAGILCESASELDRVHYAVVGIGVNVNWTTDEMPEEILETATSLQVAGGRKVDRAWLTAALLNAFEPVYRQWCGEGLTAFIAELEGVSFLQGREVVIVEPHQEIQGVVAGLTEDGALRLRLAGREDEQIIYCGDIKVGY